MGESNTVVNAYTLYRYLQQYCSHPSNYTYHMFGTFKDIYEEERALHLPLYQVTPYLQHIKIHFP